jgi:type II secretory pathway component GspD/PulD (secretin)
MFKFLLSVFLLVFPFLSFARPVPISFDSVKLSVFIQGIYGDILKKNFVIAPDLLSQTRLVTLKTTVDEEKLPSFMSGFLERMSVSQVEQDGVVYLSASSGVPSQSPLIANLSAPLPPVVGDFSSSASHSLAFGTPYLYVPKRVSNDVLCSYVNSVFRNNACSIVGVASVFKLPESDLDSLKNLLPDFDRVVPRVLVSVSLIEVVSGRSQTYGLTLAGNVLGGAFKLSPGTISGAGALSITSSDASLVLDQLLSDSRFKQISSPSALAISGQRFSINVGDRQPTLGAVVQNGVGVSTQSVVYQNSGVILDVLPSVAIADQSSRVYLDMTVEVSSFKSTTSGVNGSPTISQRRLKTYVSTASDEVLVLGGLTSKSSTSSDARLFGFLPVGSSDVVSDLDLLLVVSARVVE